MNPFSLLTQIVVAAIAGGAIGASSGALAAAKGKRARGAAIGAGVGSSAMVVLGLASAAISDRSLPPAPTKEKLSQ